MGFDDKPPSIAKFNGSPNEPNKLDETSRWNRCLEFLSGASKLGKLFKKGAALARAYSEAESNRKNAEAEKFGQEAALAAAKADAETQKTVGVVNDEIERIFTSPDTPETAKLLQVANLLDRNPQIAKQLEHINELYTKLNLLRGTVINLQLPVPNPAQGDAGTKE